MAMKVSAIFVLKKTERKALETIKEHTIRDISYESGGTFGLDDEEVDTKAVKLAKKGIELLDFILKGIVNVKIE